MAGAFAHLHKVRYAQIKAHAKDLLDSLEKFSNGAVPTVTEIKNVLKASANTIES